MAWSADPASFDIMKLDLRFIEDPFPTYARLREASPVHRNPDGSYFLTRYADVRALLTDERMTSDKSLEFPKLFGDTPYLEHLLHLMVFVDPPRHSRIRRRLSYAFAPKAIATWEGFIVEVVDELIGNIRERKRFDLISDYAYSLPVAVIARLLDVPKLDRALFGRLCAAITGPLNHAPSPESIKTGSDAVEEFKAYFRELIAARRRTPGTDLISVMLEVQDDDGNRLSELELLHNCAFLLNAGHETTCNLIGNAVKALFQFPGEMQRLRRDSNLAESAVEEFLRYDSPNQLGGRRAKEDVEYGGVRIPAKSFIWISNGAANRDGAQFPDPDRLDIGRQPNRHLAFGHGIHLCLGANLARLEGKHAIVRLIGAFPELHPEAPPVSRGHPRYRGLRSFAVSA
jgi:cytochrome P450